MRITIIFDDQMVYVDGVAIECPITPHRPDLHAVQWYDSKGEVEIKDGDNFPAIYSRDVKPYYDIWLTEKAKIDAEEQALIDYANSPEGIAERHMAEAKAERASAVNAITVEVDGMVFDGDESAQERMSRAVTTARASADIANASKADGEEPDNYLDYTTSWVLADNTIATVTIAQLAQACRLAGEAQTGLWVVPYEGN